MSEVFLSYSRDDLAIARRFAEGLEREGFTVWWDQTLDPGEAYDHVTEKALKQAGAVVVLWSRKSVESRWVRAEATLAQRNKTLAPVMIEPCERPIMFELTQTADLSGWHGDPADRAWLAYVASLRRFLKKEPMPALPLVVARKPGPGRTVGIAASLLLFAGVGWWFVSQREGADGDAPIGAAGKVAPASEEVTLAVLPFADISTARDQETFSDGLTEEILNQLAQIKGLAVTGRTSSFSFKGKNEDLRVIAEKLGVANLLEGSIRKEGNDLRITAQLINGRSGAHLWSKTYARKYADVFALQEEIARDVAGALSVALGTVVFSHAEGGTNVPEALEKFLAARALTQRGSRDVETAESIVRLTQEAVALDPEFAVAWFMLWDFLRLGAPEGQTDPALEKERSNAFSRGRAATPPESGLANWLRYGDLMVQGKWAEAEPFALASYEAGSRFDRYLSNNTYVGFLQMVGRVREAVQVQQRMVKFDPLAIGPSLNLQRALMLAGLAADAEAEYQRSLGLDGDPGVVELLSLTRLMFDPRATPADVQARYRTVLIAAPEMAEGKALFDSLGDAEAARAAVRERLERATGRDAAFLLRTAAFADFLGDKDTALVALQRASDERRREPARASRMGELWNPWRTQLRADPRFKQVVRDLGLVEYWRASGNWGDFCKPLGADDFECH